MYSLNTYISTIYISFAKSWSKLSFNPNLENYPYSHLQNNFFKFGYFYFHHPLESFSLPGVHNFSCTLLSIVYFMPYKYTLLYNTVFYSKITASIKVF
jgi:hypothetical protein